jgi:hypothetical protein
MPVKTEPIDIPFGGGVDEKTRIEKVAPGSFLALQNLRVVKRGSYSKRLGYASIARTRIDTGSNMPSGAKLASYRDELLQSDGVNLWTRSASLGAWRNVEGYAPQFNVQNMAVAAIPSAGPTNAYALISHDCALIGSYAVIAWNIYNPGYSSDPVVFASVIDTANGSIVSPPTRIFQGAGIRMVVLGVGTSGVILFSKADGIYGAVIDLSSIAGVAAGWTNPSFPSDPKDFGIPFINAPSPASDSGIFDATGIDGSHFAIVYVNDNTLSSNGNSLTLASYDSTLSVVSSTTITASSIEGTKPTEVSIAGSSSDGILWIAYPFDNTNHVHMEGRDPSTLLLSSSAVNVIDMDSGGPDRLLLGITGTNEATLIASANNTSIIRNVSKVTSTTTPQPWPARAYNIKATIRPFRVNGRAYFGMGDALDKNSQWIIDWTATFADQVQGSLSFPNTAQDIYLRPAAALFPRLCDPSAVYSGHGSHAMIVSGTKAMVATVAKFTAESSSIRLVTMDWADPIVGQPSTFLECAAFSGGVPSCYDGTRDFEIGFFTRPSVTGEAVTATSGPGLTGRYNYIVVYEHIDSRGQWHISNVSDPVTVSPTTQWVQLTISVLQVTNRIDPTSNTFDAASQVRIAVYRTTGDGGTTGTVYYRVSGLEQINSVDTESIQIVDTRDDSYVSTNPTLYTQPGIPNTAQAKVNPPPLSCLIQHGDRLVGCDGKNIWYSGQATEGEAPWFADLFQFPVEPGGNITALASMDGSLVIFKRNAIYFVDGSGPADNGAGGDFASPQAISTEVGCIEPRSIVVTSDGIMFQSLRGIELLTRARSVATYFGQPVEGELSARPIVTSAVLDEAKGRVFFSLADSNGATSGSFVVWDMVNQVWTIETTGEQAVKDSIMWGQNVGTVPVRTWLSSSGAIWQESTSSYLDAGTNWVPSVLTTPWIHSGLVGYQLIVRAILLAQAATGHDLTIEVSYDYSDTPTDSKTWTAAEISSFATSREQLEIGFTQPECTAFQLRVSDATPSSGSVGTGQGAVLIGLQVDGADQGILIPMAEANRK